ncbi:MAG: phosphate ABC transporter permease PstA [Rhodocyclaceae bacterium]|nr:phosphate ABC transporter permease PstA [Rhodocyclaceae bacterium]
MTEPQPAPACETTPDAAAVRLARIRATLPRRHARERRFRALGRAAVGFGVLCVVFLFASILVKGVPAFWQAQMVTEVYFDPARIRVPPPPQPQQGETPAQFQAREYDWRDALAAAHWEDVLVDALLAHLPPDAAQHRAQVARLVTRGERYRVRDMLADDFSLLGQRVPLALLADAHVDVWFKGTAQEALPAELRRWAEELRARGILRLQWNSALLTHADSRASPASAGLAGALVGSLYMMVIVLVLSVPVGVASAIWLEEFAPKNRWTDLIEVNINNLAAVPSIIFGLLGAAIFINALRLPMSAPLVGGLVLSLMTLPTVIIAARVSLQAIPGSIRQAALGIGASRVQTVFHHLLPLALPGILTGAILGVARAIGEAAPLLLIGMSAFVGSVAENPLEPSAALPMQIYLWQGNELRTFFEPRACAAIVVLLVLMLGLNALAIFLRRRFERRW